MLLISNCAFISAIDKNSFYISISANSCHNCNKLASTISKNQNLFKEVKFVFNSNEINEQQAKMFLYDLNIKQSVKIIVDDSIFKLLNQQNETIIKPTLLVKNTLGATLLYTSVDSISFYKKEINSYLPKKVVSKSIEIQRLKYFYGPRTISLINDYVFILNWQINHKIFFINLESFKLDSIDLKTNDTLLKNLLVLAGQKNLEPEKMKSFFAEIEYPVDPLQFNTNFTSNEKTFSTEIDLLFFDPKNNQDSILMPNRETYLFSFEPNKRKAIINKLKRWKQDSLNENITNNLMLDYNYYSQINDSTWLLGGKENNDEYNSQSINNKFKLYKPFFLFKLMKDKSYEFGDSMIVYKNDIMLDFKNTEMNEVGRIYPYFLAFPHLIFNESGTINNIGQNNGPIDLLSYNKRISYIFDAYIENNNINILVQEEKHFFTYLINLETKKMLNKTDLGSVDSRGNVVYRQGKIIYISKSGLLKIISEITE
jgi:hypothetical protein